MKYTYIIDDKLLPDTTVWAYLVKLRDKFTCQHCGYQNNGKLQAHHINKDNTKVLVINNGITLCTKCHARLHMLTRKELLKQKVKSLTKPRSNVTKPENNMLTMTEACEVLGLSPYKVLKLVQEAGLTGYRMPVGKIGLYYWRFKRTEIEKIKNTLYTV